MKWKHYVFISLTWEAFYSSFEDILPLPHYVLGKIQELRPPQSHTSLTLPSIPFIFIAVFPEIVLECEVNTLTFNLCSGEIHLAWQL